MKQRGGSAANRAGPGRPPPQSKGQAPPPPATAADTAAAAPNPPHIGQAPPVPSSVTLQASLESASLSATTFKDPNSTNPPPPAELTKAEAAQDSSTLGKLQRSPATNAPTTAAASGGAASHKTLPASSSSDDTRSYANNAPPTAATSGGTAFHPVSSAEIPKHPVEASSFKTALISTTSPQFKINLYMRCKIVQSAKHPRAKFFDSDQMHEAVLKGLSQVDAMQRTGLCRRGGLMIYLSKIGKAVLKGHYFIIGFTTSHPNPPAFDAILLEAQKKDGFFQFDLPVWSALADKEKEAKPKTAERAQNLPLVKTKVFFAHDTDTLADRFTLQVTITVPPFSGINPIADAAQLLALLIYGRDHTLTPEKQDEALATDARSIASMLKPMRLQSTEHGDYQIRTITGGFPLNFDASDSQAHAFVRRLIFGHYCGMDYREGIHQRYYLSVPFFNDLQAMKNNWSAQPAVEAFEEILSLPGIEALQQVKTRQKRRSTMSSDDSSSNCSDSEAADLSSSKQALRQSILALIPPPARNSKSTEFPQLANPSFTSIQDSIIVEHPTTTPRLLVVEPDLFRVCGSCLYRRSTLFGLTTYSPQILIAHENCRICSEKAFAFCPNCEQNLCTSCQRRYLEMADEDIKRKHQKPAQMHPADLYELKREERMKSLQPTPGNALTVKPNAVAGYSLLNHHTDEKQNERQIVLSKSSKQSVITTTSMPPNANAAKESIPEGNSITNPTVACTFFRKYARCNYGSNCIYSHDANAPLPANKKSVAQDHKPDSKREKIDAPDTIPPPQLTAENADPGAVVIVDKGKISQHSDEGEVNASEILALRGFDQESIKIAISNTDGSLKATSDYLDDYALARLVDLGYEPELAEHALRMHEGHFTRAAQLLTLWSTSPDPLFDKTFQKRFPSTDDCRAGTLRRAPGDGACLWHAVFAAISYDIEKNGTKVAIADSPLYLKRFVLSMIQANRNIECLYPQAIPYGPLHPTTPEAHLRSQMNNGVGSLALHGKPSLQYSSLDQYCEQAANPATYGEHFEIMAAAAFMHYNIAVFVKHTVIKTTMGLPAQYQEKETIRCYPTMEAEPLGTITLVNNNGEAHYDWLQLEDAAVEIAHVPPQAAIKQKSDSPGKVTSNSAIPTHNSWMPLGKLSQQEEFSQKQRNKTAKALFEWVMERRKAIRENESPFASLVPLFTPYPPKSEIEAELINKLFKPCKKSEENCTCADCWDQFDDPWATTDYLNLPMLRKGALSILETISSEEFRTAHKITISVQSFLAYDILASMCNSIHLKYIRNLMHLNDQEADQLKTVIALLCQCSTTICEISKEISTRIQTKHDYFLLRLLMANMDLEFYIQHKWHEPFLISQPMPDIDSEHHATMISRSSQGNPPLSPPIGTSQQSAASVKSSRDSQPIIAAQFEIEVADRVEQARNALKMAEQQCSALNKDNCKQTLESLLAQRALLTQESLLCQRVAEDYPSAHEHAKLYQAFNTHSIVMLSLVQAFDALILATQKRYASEFKALAKVKGDSKQTMMDAFLFAVSKHGPPAPSHQPRTVAEDGAAIVVEKKLPPGTARRTGKSAFHSNEAICDDDRESESQNSEVLLSDHSSDEEQIVNLPKSQEASRRNPRFRLAQLNFKDAGVGDGTAVATIPITFCKEGHRVISPFKVPANNPKSREKLRCAWCLLILGTDLPTFSCRCESHLVCQDCIIIGKTFPSPPSCSTCHKLCSRKTSLSIRQCLMPNCAQPTIGKRASAWYCSSKTCDFIACIKCLDESSHPPPTIACSKPPPAATAAADANAPSSGNPSTHAGQSGLGRL